MKLYKKSKQNEKSILFHYFSFPTFGKNLSSCDFSFSPKLPQYGKTQKNISRPRRCLGLKNLFSRFSLLRQNLGEKLK